MNHHGLLEIPLFVTPVFSFEDGEGGWAKAFYEIHLTNLGKKEPTPHGRMLAPEYWVFQMDVDKEGRVWNYTPCRPFSTLEAAQDWAVAECHFAD